MAQRVPTTAADPEGPAGRFIERHGIEKYRRDYERGWRAAYGLDAADNDGRSGSDAWMDGYLDRASREKWHLLRCANHGNETGGCGVA
ncbi:hypothetical protein [Terracoccus sp. 273MFTsu3.1]|uniref:hypothetical protein n=1 Tax=Terracoccus sp. 273MFTsu3.1 TaxID=1172188 RepID=UPI000380B523|nr:hypothetical protein [Terracoccus sp. 273MFTsu3.1]